MGVSVFTVLTDHFGVVKLVVQQKVLGVLISVDFNFGNGVVDCRQLVALAHSRLQPVVQHSESVPFFKLLNQRFQLAVASKIVEDLFQIVFFTFKVNKGSQNGCTRVGVVLKNVDFDEPVEVVFVQVFY